MARRKRSSAVADPVDHEARTVELPVDLLGYRGLALVATGALFFLLLSEVTHNLLASVVGSVLATGVALDLVLRPVRVLVGREAMVRHGLRTSRMRYADVVDVEDVSDERPRLRVHATSGSWTFAGRAGEGAIAELSQRLEERLTAFRTHASALSAPVVPVARGDRDDATWTQDLRDLVAGEHNGYRDAAVSPDVLLRIAENPTSSDEERIAALVALSPTRASDPTVRARIAALAPETTTLDVSEALDAWLEGDDETLTATLYRVRS